MTPGRRPLLLAALGAAAAPARAMPRDGGWDRVREAGVLVMGVEVEETGLCTRDADGQLDGYLIALGQGLAQGLGLRPAFVESVAGQRLASLRAGAFDLLLSSPPLGWEALRLAMFTAPYARLDWRVLLPESLAQAGPPGLRGLRLAAPAGLTTLWIQRQLAWAGVELLPVAHWQTAQAAIQAGVAQGAVASELMAGRLKARLPGLAEGPALESALVAAALRWGEHDLLQAVEAQLRLMRQRGVLDILSRHFLGRPAPGEERE